MVVVEERYGGSVREALAPGDFQLTFEREM